jgi:hypothetical protein
MEKVVLDIALWIILGSALVLIITNASNFATAVTSVGGIVTQESNILAGH